VAAFRLDRTNATRPAPNNPLLLNIAATRTEGVEAEVTGRLLPTLNVSASYTWLDARLRDVVRLAQTPRARLHLGTLAGNPTPRTCRRRGSPIDPVVCYPYRAHYHIAAGLHPARCGAVLPRLGAYPNPS